MVASEFGCCSTSCEVTIKEAEEVVRETIPTFIDEPVPVVAMHGSVVSFCARVLPATSKVKWIVCGREITESSRGTIVSTLNLDTKRHQIVAKSKPNVSIFLFFLVNALVRIANDFSNLFNLISVKIIQIKWPRHLDQCNIHKIKRSIARCFVYGYIMFRENNNNKNNRIYFKS